MPSVATSQLPPPTASWSVVKVSGELDMSSVPELRDRLCGLVADPSHEVIVDLSDVTFMDCSTLGLLMSARARLGDRMWLRGVPPSVSWLLRLAGLQTAFAVVDEPTLHGLAAH